MKGAPPAGRTAVGRLMQTLPDHDHAAAARRFKRYWLFGAGASRPLSDVLLAYRCMLEQER